MPFFLSKQGGHDHEAAWCLATTRFAGNMAWCVPFPQSLSLCQSRLVLTSLGCFFCARLELGRPQIHGYPIASVAFTNRLQFVSGADEKIVRVFDAPKIFVATLKELSGLDLGDEVRLYRYLFFLLFLLGV